MSTPSRARRRALVRPLAPDAKGPPRGERPAGLAGFLPRLGKGSYGRGGESPHERGTPVHGAFPLQ
jgi:hypothetical protein